MKVAIDIGHPAHVHLFKNLAWRLVAKGHQVLFSCRERQHIVHLLEFYGFEHVNLGKHYKKIITKILGMAKYDYKLFVLYMKYKPDIVLSHGSIYAAHAAWLINRPHISLNDSFNMEQLRLSLPFTDVVLTGDYPHPSLGKREIRFPGYHELAYLHPKVFSADPSVLSSLELANGEKFAIVRFVAWNASHDVGLYGFSNKNKVKLVKELSKYLRVFVSSEDNTIPELTKYQIRIRPEKMHDLMAFSSLFIGEGATMAEEAAVLGVPSIYVNSIGLGVIPDLVKYGLLDHFSESLDDQSKAISMALQYAKSDVLKKERVILRDAMLCERIDVSSFLTWFVENYPISKHRTLSKTFTFDRFR